MAGSVETRLHAAWFASAAWDTLLCAACPMLTLIPLAVIVVASPAHHALLTEIGVDRAVVVFTILALHFVISARLRWVEAPFGLDMVLRFHRTMGLVAVGLLSVHALLLPINGFPTTEHPS